MKISISEKETIILTRRYVDKYKDLSINYLRFLKEINSRIHPLDENPLREQDQNQPQIVPQKQKTCDFSYQPLIQRISWDCYINGKDLGFYFRQSDTLRKNLINYTQFYCAFTFTKIKLSNQELELLTSRYGRVVNNQQLIDYIAFLKDMIIYDRPESLQLKPIPETIKGYLQ